MNAMTKTIVAGVDMDLVRVDGSIPLSDEERVAIESLRMLTRRAHEAAIALGWLTDPKTGKKKVRSFPEVVALIHSEISEALDADRANLMDDKLPHRAGKEVELADALLRIFDKAGEDGLDLGAALVEKARFNRLREDHKLENRKKAGGKKY